MGVGEPAGGPVPASHSAVPASGGVDPAGCAAPDQSAPMPAGVDLARHTVIAGVVTGARGPVAGAYVRLLDPDGEFVAEVVTATTGQFRFFAAPGRWSLRALSHRGAGDAEVIAERGLNEVELRLTADRAG
jgi:uncharacterized protein DUF1416